MSAARAEASAPRSLVPSRWVVLLAAVAVVGLAFRVWTYRSILGTFNSDEAVVGLMVRHALHGHLSTFFWGQAYGGTQEVLATVPVFLVTGSGWLSLRIVPIAITAAATLLLYPVGRRTIGEPAARTAVALFWVWPGFVIYQNVHQAGFYATDLLYCVLLLLLALRIVERPDRQRIALFGLVLGLAFWQTAQIVPIAAGAIAWTVWKAPRALRQLPVALLAAAVGALPWIVWNARHGWESLHLGGLTADTYVHSLRLLVSPILPMLLGLRAPFSAQLLVPAAAAYLAYAALLGLLAWGAVRSRNRPISLLYTVGAVFPFVYALSPKTSYLNSEPRFTLVVAPIVALLVAQVATSYARAAALLTLACLVSFVTLQRMETWYLADLAPESYANGFGPRHIVQAVPRDLSPLVSTLDRLGLDRVYADYWIAYRLAFDTRERIIGAESPIGGLRFFGGEATPAANPSIRYRPYEREVAAARHGFVFFRRAPGDAAARTQLERHGYTAHDVGSFVVYAPPR